MITLSPAPIGKPHPGHTVRTTKQIGSFPDGYEGRVMICKMFGRKYSPGKDERGKWIDTVGEPEDRLMVYSPKHYACCTEQELQDAFDEILDV